PLQHSSASPVRSCSVNSGETGGESSGKPRGTANAHLRISRASRRSCHDAAALSAARVPGSLVKMILISRPELRPESGSEAGKDGAARTVHFSDAQSETLSIAGKSGR